MTKLLFVALGCIVAVAQAAVTDLGPTGFLFADGTTVVEGGGDAIGTLDVPTTAGDVTLVIEAQRTEFLLPSEDSTCSNKAIRDIFSYQSVEVFLANDENQYIEIGVTPNGAYYAALYEKVVEEPRAKDAAPAGALLVELLEVAVTMNPDAKCTMLEGDDTCWGATLTFPQEYLPLNKITKYNMYLTNSADIQAVKSGEDEPSFHNLDNFETLSVITATTSALWTAALDKDNNNFVTKFVADQPACTEAESTSTADDDYSVTVTYTRMTEQAGFKALIDVSKGSPLKPDFDSEIDANDESVWLSFTASDTMEQLQVAVTPYGQNRVSLIANGKDISLRNYELSGVFCETPTTDKVEDWSCTIYIPWHYLPKTMNMHQVVHRIPTEELEEETTITTHYSCPEWIGDSAINFDGCSVDRNLFVNATNDAESDYWVAAKANVPAVTDPSTGGAGHILTSVTFVAVSVAIAIMA